MKTLALAFVAIVLLPSSLLSQPVTIPVPNGDFEGIYKPGSDTITADLGAGWTQGLGLDTPMDNGTATYADGSTGDAVDIPGWIGADAQGWIDNGGTYDRDTSFPNRQGSVAAQIATPDGLNYYLSNGGGWGNPAGGLIVSEAALATVEAGLSYTLSMLATGPDGPATPVVLELLADGVAVTPSASVDPELNADWQEVSRTYDAASLAEHIGASLTIRLGVDRGASGGQSCLDAVLLSYVQEPIAIPVPNGDFEQIYKPGSDTISADLGAGWTQGLGPDTPMDDGTATYSDGSTGDAVDIPGWIGADAQGWVDNGGTYGRDTSFPNRQGSVAAQIATPDGLNYYLSNGGGWGNPAGGLIVSEAAVATVEAGLAYTLSILATGPDGPAIPVVLELLADGVALTPSASVDPELNADWQEVSRTYDATSLAAYVGASLTIRLGVDRGASGGQSCLDAVLLSYLPEPIAIPVPNGDFETIYKPGSDTITAEISADGWTQGIGPDTPMDNGTAIYSDGSTGDAVDIPGWVGADPQGWVDNGGTYGRDTTTGNRQGSVGGEKNTPDGLYFYLSNGGGWGNPAGGLIVSEAPLAMVEDGTYTLSMLAAGPDGPALPIVLELLADGIALTPSAAVDPELGADWQEVSRTYDVASLAEHIGASLTIRLGVDRGASGGQSLFDAVSLSFEPAPAGPPMQSIAIDNPGFEDPVLTADDWTWLEVSGWTWMGGEGPGIWHVTGADFDPVVAPEGQNVLYTENAVGDVGGVAQVLAETLAANADYTLTVEVGNSNYYYNGGYSVQLLAGGVVIAEDNDSLWPEYATWATSTVEYSYDPADAALVGQPLEIRLLNLTLDKDSPPADEVVGVEFDNVTLSYVPGTASGG